jgi:hypothetical protein
MENEMKLLKALEKYLSKSNDNLSNKDRIIQRKCEDLIDALYDNR